MNLLFMNILNSTQPMNFLIFNKCILNILKILKYLFTIACLQ